MTSGVLRRDRVTDTFAARDLKTPKQQNPVDSLAGFAEEEEYGVELHRRRKGKVEYTVI